MAKLKKEDMARLEGMQKALEIVKTKGVEELEAEVRWRCNNQISTPYTRDEMIAVARKLSEQELMYIAASMAYTLVYEIKMPPSVVKDYLRKFNEKIAQMRMDPEEYRRITEMLDKDMAMNRMIKEYLQEE